MATITKKDLIDRIAAHTGKKRTDVKETVQSFLEEVIEDLGRGNRLEFRDFGVFEVKDRSARTAQNPKTLERVDVPAKRTVRFKVGRMMRQRVDSDSIAACAAGTEKVEGERHDGTNGAGGYGGLAGAAHEPQTVEA